jgi:hypothetical protein
MSISYQSSDPSVQAQALKWQTLVLREKDSPIITPGSGSGGFLTVTPNINVQQTVDNVAGSSAPVCIKILGAGGAPASATSVAVSGSTITPTFAAAPVSGDIIIVHYVISE